MKVRASSGVVERFLFPLDPPVPHVHVPRSSHPIPSILYDNPECDPLPYFAFAPDRHEGLGIVLEAVPPRRHRSNSSYGRLHHQPPPNINRFESPHRIRALANPCLRSIPASSVYSIPHTARRTIFNVPSSLGLPSPDFGASSRYTKVRDDQLVLHEPLQNHYYDRRKKNIEY